MEGYYTFITLDGGREGETMQVAIPHFALSAPATAG